MSDVKMFRFQLTLDDAALFGMYLLEAMSTMPEDAMVNICEQLVASGIPYEVID